MFNDKHHPQAPGLREKKTPKPTNLRIGGTGYPFVSFLTNIISKLKGDFPMLWPIIIPIS